MEPCCAATLARAHFISNALASLECRLTTGFVRHASGSRPKSRFRRHRRNRPLLFRYGLIRPLISQPAFPPRWSHWHRLPQQSSPGHERALLAVQQCGEALRKELEAELSHVASELAAQPALGRHKLPSPGSRPMALRCFSDRRTSSACCTTSSAFLRPRVRDKAPPALPAPSAGAARPTLMGNAASAAAAAPPAASSAVSGSPSGARAQPARPRAHCRGMAHRLHAPLPPPSCPEQPARLRRGGECEPAAAHPSLLALVTSTAEVSAKFVAPLVHAPDYVALLERSLPKSWEPPMRLGAANPYAASNGGLAWSADGERRSTREVSTPAAPSPPATPRSSVTARVEARSLCRHIRRRTARVRPRRRTILIRFSRPSRWPPRGMHPAPCARRSTT